MAAIELDDVFFSYGDRPALRGIGFSVEEGQIAGLLGPNGGGKTTTFRILSTLLRPQRGSARVGDSGVTSDPFAVRRRIGVVFQSRSLDLELTVEENLLHQGHLYGMRGRALDERIRELAGRFGLADRLNQRAKSLSGGLQRRADLAKALLHRPRILLLDEPTNGLDPAVTILLTTHSMEEAERCDHLIIIAEGRVVAEGSPSSLKSRIGSEIILIRAGEPEPVCQRLVREFGLAPTVVDGTIRIEYSNGHQLVGQLMETLGDQIDSITATRASLEDVFVRETGHRFQEGREETAAASR
jgi:ABC-2 type transport system ATP-binding protein